MWGACPKSSGVPDGRGAEAIRVEKYRYAVDPCSSIVVARFHPSDSTEFSITDELQDYHNISRNPIISNWQDDLNVSVFSDPIVAFSIIRPKCDDIKVQILTGYGILIRMFNAISTDDKEICILDFDDNDREDLRLRANHDDFRCPICKFHLNIRLGNDRCWHFAHRETGPDDCPMRHRDAASDALIAMLYRWLKGKPAIRDVGIDYLPDEIKLDNPIDLFFRTNKQKYLLKVVMKRVWC